MRRPGYIAALWLGTWAMLLTSAAVAAPAGRVVANGTVSTADPAAVAPTAPQQDDPLKALAERLATQRQQQPSVADAPPTPTTPQVTAQTPQPLDLAEAAQRLGDPSLDPIEQSPLGARLPQGERDTLPTTDGVGNGGNWMLSTLTALGVVIGLILLLRWVWIRLSGQVVARSTPAVELLSRTAIGPRNHVLLLRVGGRVLIVGDSSSGLRTLANLDDPDEVSSLLAAVTASRPSSVSQSFSQMMNRFGADYDTPAGSPETGLDNQEHLVDRARESVSSVLSRIRVLSGRGGSR